VATETGERATLYQMAPDQMVNPGADYEDRERWMERHRYQLRAQCAAWSGREAGGIFVAAPVVEVDPVNGYPGDNAVHCSVSGYAQIARSIHATIARVVASG